MLAMPFVLRQASNPIQYPCDRSLHLSKPSGLSAGLLISLYSQGGQYPGCTGLVDVDDRRVVLSSVDKQAPGHGWEGVLCKRQDSPHARVAHPWSACLTAEVQNG